MSREKHNGLGNSKIRYSENKITYNEQNTKIMGLFSAHQEIDEFYDDNTELKGI